VKLDFKNFINKLLYTKIKMSLGVEFEEDPILSRGYGQNSRGVSNQSAGNHQGMAGQNPLEGFNGLSAMNTANQNINNAGYKTPWIVKLVLKTRLVKTETQAQIFLLSTILLLVLISIYMFFSAITGDEIVKIVS
jgi:hypothetical protein